MSVLVMTSECKNLARSSASCRLVFSRYMKMELSLGIEKGLVLSITMVGGARMGSGLGDSGLGGSGLLCQLNRPWGCMSEKPD